jgi:predicted nucleotidyltransferase
MVRDVVTLALDRLSRRAGARARAAWARAATVLARLAELGVEAKVVGSLARGDFAAHSDVDFLVVSCPRSLKYRIEAEVEDLMGGLPFQCLYLDEARPAYRDELLAEARDAPARL